MKQRRRYILLALTTILLALAMAACTAESPEATPTPPTLGGSTPTATIVSHGGPVKDYVSLVDNLRAAGATVDPAGTGSADLFAPQGQLSTVNGERVETFEFASAEEADAAAGGVSATGTSIRTTMADGTQMVSMVDWFAPAHYYKAGRLIALYVGCDSDVINALQETMGPQFAGAADLSLCAERVPPPAVDIRQALEAADGSEVTVSGFLVVDRDGVARLCSGLLSSFPPQCGDDRIDLLGFDASSVPNSETPQRPSEIGTSRWTNSQITVTGIKGIGGLAEVRLSTAMPTPIPTPVAAVTVQPTLTPIPTIPQYQSQQVVFEGATFDVELPVTPEQRARGLMGREQLGDREGMLFVYDVEGLHRIWMKGMVIPLDMVWIDADSVVAGVTANVPPAPEGTIPEIYSPPRPILYVLEINAGLAEATGIRVGSQARFVLKIDDEAG